MTSGLKAPAIMKPPSLPNAEEVGRRMYSAASQNLWAAGRFKTIGDNVRRVVGRLEIEDLLLVSPRTKKFADAADTVDKVADVNEAFDKFSRYGAYLNDLERRTIGRLGAVTEVVRQYKLDLARVDKDLVEAWYSKEYLKSDAAASMMTFIKREGEILRQQAEPFNAQLRNLERCLGEIKGPLSKEVQKGIAKAVDYVEKLPLGKRILEGRKAVGPVLDWAGKAVDVLGVASAAYKTFSEDPKEGLGRRLVKGATAGLAAAGTEFVLKKNPVVALADIALEKIGGEKNTIGHFYQSTGRIFNAYAAALVDGNAAPLNKVHEMNMSGENGAVYKGYALIGESLARTGWLDSSAVKYGEWRYKVSTEARSSSLWHRALDKILP